MARHENLSIGRLVVDEISGNAAGWRRRYFLNSSIGSDGNEGRAFDRPVKNLFTAYGKLETGRKDAVIFQESPLEVVLLSGFDWAKDMCGILGTAASLQSQGNVITHGEDFETLFTVSGDMNQFRNLRLMHGRDDEDNECALSVTGNANSFHNVNIEGPVAEAESAEAGYSLVKLSRGSQYFDSCVFGSEAVTRAAGSVIELVTKTAPTCIFRDCIFLMNASANAPRFIKCGADLKDGIAIFDNCSFINIGTSLTAAIDHTGLGDFKIFLSASCSFVGASVVATSLTNIYNMGA